MTGQSGTGRRPDGAAFIIAALLAGFGAVLLWDASTIPDRGGYAGIGPAAMPKVVGWGLIVLAAATFLGAFRGRLADVPRQNPVPLILIGGGLVLQIALLNVVGFSLATGILFAATAAAFGKRNLLVTLPIGTALAFGLYGLFDGILRLNLPGGLLETLIYGG
ncbi:tripartite tricarboxylate transporter TctB family protein [Tabrizicola sp.]|uniref:tripartite tricarboxylate transporter TctB family protein n=1 Tax=Tabrizicola sp. TaxID=2005166 RepID=UPI0026364D88|nr:tripartite tricarboxylate transporter TctB family protein [Tabrizicola sp.]MDM7931932.1 tripartite tricarboxylate transporter TctB family protein [Tabrizicola sp.]